MKVERLVTATAVRDLLCDGQAKTVLAHPFIG